jgi:hypothetical protein
VLVRNLLAKLEGASLQGSQGLPHIRESSTKFRNHKSVTRGQNQVRKKDTLSTYTCHKNVVVVELTLELKFPNVILPLGAILGSK